MSTKILARVFDLVDRKLRAREFRLDYRIDPSSAYLRLPMDPFGTMYMAFMDGAEGTFIEWHDKRIIVTVDGNEVAPPEGLYLLETGKTLHARGPEIKHHKPTELTVTNEPFIRREREL